MPAQPHGTVAAYLKLLTQQLAESEQLATALKDLARRPGAAADVAAILERHNALAVLSLNVALTHELARAIHDAARDGG